MQIKNYNMQTRLEIINFLIKKNNYQSYLEIGVQYGHVIKNVTISYKVGVDPLLIDSWNKEILRHKFITHKLTSDEFFKVNKEKFDVIFIDGMHESQQVYKDIINSLNILNSNGTIICHDMNPINYMAQVIPRQVKQWNGDCWKAWVKLKQERVDLSMFVIDTDMGVGVISAGSQEKLVINCEISYEQLILNKKLWLNLITIDEFIKYLNDGEEAIRKN